MRLRFYASNRRKTRHKCLPLPTRRGLSRVKAAGYIGIGASKFDAMVADGRMAKPKKIDGRRVWDVRSLDRSFDALSGGEESDYTPWDD